jgi:hypothetical protein
MPNWCDTTYKCVGDPKEVRSLYKIIKANDRRKNPRVKNGFGKLWLGCIINALGDDWEKLRCRGEITDYQLDDNVLTIYQNTAWCEQEGFRECIEKKYPSIKVYYQEQEPGCDVFYTNDNSGIYFPDRYFLDSYDDWYYWQTIEDAAKHISGIVGHEVNPTVKAIDDALEDYQQEHEDEDLFYSFHEFEVVDD